MKQHSKQLRPWYTGKAPPDEDILGIVDRLDPEAAVFYDQGQEKNTGEYADIVKGLYGKMDLLKRSPDEFRTWTEEDGYLTFYEALLDFAGTEVKDRVQVLQTVGTFKFRASAGPDEKKSLISAIFSEAEGNEDPNMVQPTRARRLSQIWSPPADSLLDYIISRPAQAGRVLSDRISPSNREPFRLIGHPFAEVRSTDLMPLKEAKIVAFERAGEIHLNTSVRTVLENWDADTAAIGGVEQVSLLDTLLLHELIELVLDETNPEYTPLHSHIIASSFERYLKGTLLSVAVEDFFLTWPPLSDAEIEERNAKQMAQELEEASAMFAEEEIPDFEDDDLEDLPVDSDIRRRKKKKKKKKVATGKVAGGKKIVKKKLIKKKKKTLTD